MGVKYDSSNYDAAADKYSELQDEYTGDKGLEKATNYGKENAKDISAQAGQVAGAQATGAARTAGMSRSKAIALGSQSAGNTAGNTYKDQYNNSTATAMQNNMNTLNAQQAMMAGAQHKDDAIYDQKKTNFNGWMGLGGSLLGAGAQIGAAALGNSTGSDESLKDIKDKTPSNRCDELLERLRK